MRFKFLLLGLGLLALSLPVLAQAQTLVAAQPGVTRICDGQTNSQYCANVNSSSALKVTGTVTSSGTVALTAGSALVGKVGIDQTTPGTTNLVAAGQVSPYPIGATAITNSSADVAAASAVATLAAASSKTTYISGFTCTSSGSTSAATVVVALSGVITGTMNYIYTSVAGATLGNPILTRTFDYPIPASATNTAIVVTMPSLGTGNLHAACTATGFQL